MGFRPMLASGGPSKGGYNASGQGSRVTSGSSRLQQSSISAGKRKGSATKKSAGAVEKLTKIGLVMLHPGGLLETDDLDGRLTFELIEESYPSANDRENWRDANLVLTEEPGKTNEPLHFNPQWGPTPIDNWLRHLFPDFFTYADARYGVRCGPTSTDFHWALMEREHKKLVLVKKRQAIIGEDLVRSRSTSGRSTAISALHFVSRYPLPPYIYKNFPAALQYVESGVIEDYEASLQDSRASSRISDSPEIVNDMLSVDDTFSTSGAEDSSDNDMPVIGKGKGKAQARRSAKASFKTTLLVGSEDDKMEEDPSSDIDDLEAQKPSPSCITSKSSSTPVKATRRKSLRLASKRAHSPVLPKPIKRAHSPVLPKPIKRRKVTAGRSLAASTPITIESSDDDDENHPLAPVASSPTATLAQDTAGTAASDMASSSSAPAGWTPPGGWDNYLRERAARGLPSPPKPKNDPWAIMRN
ncbi:hypothetical protein C8Q76DRAFT_715075 [Earliella scabrosa]|nr:hypothetical protein C8Q76DRAFT_715075 [Earliella scabrosa]